jgi:cytochrome P450 family 26 subfamily A
MLYHVTFTHKLSPLFADERDQFKPERWQTTQGQCQNHKQTNDQNRSCDRKRTMTEQLKSEARFHYIPFGAGQRRCVGKEFAKLVLRLFVMETVRTGRWRLVNGFPEIKTCPIVYPKDKLLVQFERDIC